MSAKRPATVAEFLAALRRPARRRARRAATPPRAAIPPGVVVLALDASSTALGWAVARARGPALDLRGFGVVRPRHAAAPDRIAAMVDALDAVGSPLLGPDPIDRIVLEWSAGHQHGAIARKMAGLATLGQAQGAIWQAVRRRAAACELVPEAEWTGRVPKPARAAAVAALFPAYAAWACVTATDPFRTRRDPGLDAADAIGLACWRLTHGGPTP